MYDKRTPRYATISLALTLLLLAASGCDESGSSLAPTSKTDVSDGGETSITSPKSPQIVVCASSKEIAAIERVVDLFLAPPVPGREGRDFLPGVDSLYTEPTFGAVVVTLNEPVDRDLRADLVQRVEDASEDVRMVLSPAMC